MPQKTWSVELGHATDKVRIKADGFNAMAHGTLFYDIVPDKPYETVNVAFFTNVLSVVEATEGVD